MQRVSKLGSAAMADEDNGDIVTILCDDTWEKMRYDDDKLTVKMNFEEFAKHSSCDAAGAKRVWMSMLVEPSLRKNRDCPAVGETQHIDEIIPRNILDTPPSSPIMLEEGHDSQIGFEDALSIAKAKSLDPDQDDGGAAVQIAKELSLKEKQPGIQRATVIEVSDSLPFDADAQPFDDVEHFDKISRPPSMSSLERCLEDANAGPGLSEAFSSRLQRFKRARTSKELCVDPPSDSQAL